MFPPNQSPLSFSAYPNPLSPSVAPSLSHASPQVSEIAQATSPHLFAAMERLTMSLQSLRLFDHGAAPNTEGRDAPMSPGRSESAEIGAVVHDGEIAAPADAISHPAPRPSRPMLCVRSAPAHRQDTTIASPVDTSPFATRRAEFDHCIEALLRQRGEASPMPHLAHIDTLLRGSDIADAAFRSDDPAHNVLARMVASRKPALIRAFLSTGAVHERLHVDRTFRQRAALLLLGTPGMQTALPPLLDCIDMFGTVYEQDLIPDALTQPMLPRSLRQELFVNPLSLVLNLDDAGNAFELLNRPGAALLIDRDPRRALIALFDAVASCGMETVKVLIASPDLAPFFWKRDAAGRNALMVAVEAGRMDFIDLATRCNWLSFWLRQKDAYGRDAVEIARSCRQWEVLAALLARSGV